MPHYPLTWVVVADSGRSRIFSLAADNAALEEVEDAVNPAARQHERDLSSDRPGRVYDSKGLGRHAMTARQSGKARAEESFAQSLAESLRDAQLAGRFERLVLFASPHFLGTLRSRLDSGVADRVAASADLDITQENAAQIRERLRKIL